MNLKDPELRARLDPYARFFGYYTAYTLSEREFVGRGDENLPVWLNNHPDFHDPPTLFGVPLEAAKKKWDTGQLHDFSYVYIDPRDERMQWHIHGFQCDSGYDVASHHEYRATLRPVAGESPTELIHRLKTHYRPKTTYTPGDAPEALYAKLDA